MTMSKIKKGCVAKCSLGMLGLITSEEKVMTRYGKLAWLGVQLSPDKAGNEWCSQNPTFVSESVENLTNQNISEDKINEKDDYLYFLKRLVDLTVSLHQLIKEGVDESDEGEKIRDECDQYWDRISEEDKDWLRKFSASFYNLVENKGKNNA
jgi:hypothetical protein